MTALTFGLLCLLLALNAARPLRGGGLAMIASFFAAWLYTEWAWVGAALATAHAATALRAGDTLAAAVAVLAAAASATLVVEVSRDRAAWRDAARTLGFDAAAPPPAWRVLFPFPPRRSGVTVERDVVYGEAGGVKLRLDVYRPSAAGGDAPGIIQVHGGAWIVGDKREQGLPLLYHMAANGWVGFNVNYRLCPRATWPEPLDDVRAAIAWVRTHAARYGVDPSCIAITGGSAGAHLAAMASLAPRTPDERVDAAALFYGIYDFTDRRSLLPPRFIHGLLRKRVVKRSIADAPDVYRDASPLDVVHPGAPPTLVIHGARDVLAPAGYASDYAAALRRQGVRAAAAILPGAQHAFDVFMSPRTRMMAAWVLGFFESERRRALSGAARGSDAQAPD